MILCVCFKIDYGGDRIILQGRRFLGYNTPVPDLLAKMREAIYFVMKESLENVKFDEENLNTFCRDILRDIGRTESAFISYFILQNLLLGNKKFGSASTKEEIASSQFLLGKRIIHNFKNSQQV